MADDKKKIQNEELETTEESEQVENPTDSDAVYPDSIGVDSDEDEATSNVADGNEWEEKAKNWEEKYKRALADYQNLEKRSLEQRREWVRSSNRELLLRILPVLDTLLLAKEHSDDQSLKVSVQQFLDILKGEGVTRIDALGKDFDPHTMEAVATDEGEDGKVIKEMQAGYMMNDTLLRPALVTVGKEESSKH